MAILTLEALEARHGDSLILHYGSATSPSFIIIDGGPDLVFKNTLRPRLDEIREAFDPDEPLPIEMLMLSHIDDDHINGILQLTGVLVDNMQSSKPPPYEIRNLWHNSFDDILANNTGGLFASVSSSVAAAATGFVPPSGLSLSQPGAAVIASVGQGRELRDNATKLKWPVNKQFKGLISAPASGRNTVDWGDNLQLTVLGPKEDRLKKLQEEWDDQLKKIKAKGDAGKALAASYADQSVYNLSSIIVLAELDGKRILLTGDGRGDDILEGLESAGLLTNGTIHVDVLKLPHHGSSRNVKEDFFRRVTADHYVASGNGKYSNPEVATLQMITKVRGNEELTIHLTNREGDNNLATSLASFIAAEKKKHHKTKMAFRDPSDLSLKVDLLDAVDY